MTILDQLAEHARERVAAAKQEHSLERLRRLAEDMARTEAEKEAHAALPRFYRAIAKPELSVICEVKKASPSKGIIDPVFDYLGTARAYEDAGADAISCLTEPKWFLGSDAIFTEIRAEVQVPMLRKDFIVDAYQLYQSRLMGADCILLICALMDTGTIREYLEICRELRLAALVETHTDQEIESALSAGALMIGVNNRNLKDFSVDLGNASRLRSLIPSDRLFVAESGVQTPEDAAALRKVGADAILVGEAMMRAEDKRAFLTAMRSAAK